MYAYLEIPADATGIVESEQIFTSFVAYRVPRQTYVWE